ncbi:threonine ammonia-lyase [Conexibacter sp. W3-3-2]|uniref:threonine ammonia-lyase n=1 Tax=Paraconexibacter algicola TaxID=2133960 RepID=A0A2T4UDS2_9ACTN|nr:MULTISPECIES: threonine ammonia-lyase [Solirubrobacterales]MTD43925.1 threonine ammonia-lyase [Conexibacter sp. W3-3-2]PTL55656.1 threonine ammonia-lyase [Paraconexibacter algicola]
MTVTADDVRRARAAVGGVARHTPVLPSATLSETTGTEVVLKAESLQRTGAFKVRGALAKLAALGEECARGVVLGSAGNHAQGVAWAARERGVPCVVYMPAEASIQKSEGAAELGADVRLVGETVDDAVAAARTHAQEHGLAFVHPFDDPDIVAGQGTLGLELLEDLPDLGAVVVPIGGGGLCSGVAVAVKAARPDVQVIGVQVASCAPFPRSLAAGEPLPALRPASTLADGIAVKRPGALTLELVGRWVDRVVVVPEDDVAEAMVLLMEKAKLVVEGAGAVGVAALTGGAFDPAAAGVRGTTCVVLSGGNVDAGTLALVARRHETEAGRRVVLFTRVPDRPGALARLLACVADTGANLLEVDHVREGVDLHVRETAVQLVLETRGAGHADAVQHAIAGAGYAARVVR